MGKNRIIDYKQAQDKLNLFKNTKIIKEQDPLAITQYGLPIRYFISGHGNEDIVITGATHGGEIISADFVMKIMEDIENKPEEWKQILDNYTIHLIPMLNPEGYLISTSAIRKLIPESMPEEEAEKICKKYYFEYRKDSTEPLPPETLKRHQSMFEGIDYTCIPDEYKELKESVKSIFEKYPDLPKNCVHTWIANGNGVDIQANTQYNPKISRINQGETLYMNVARYNNIDYSHPGPMNCPFDKERGFKPEIETKAIDDLLNNLKSKGTLFGYLNLHSTGGEIYQRPSNIPEGINLSEEELAKKEIQNYMLSNTYRDKTYKNTGKNDDGTDKKDTTKYTIRTNKADATSSNDIFRLKYPLDLLVELSPMGGNPIAPYGDIKGNYANVINSNLNAIKYYLQVGSLSKMVADSFYENIKALKDKDDYTQVTSALDMIYKEFAKRIESLKPQAIKTIDERIEVPEERKVRDDER